ncbi:MAG: carboxypeptidase regulatory-like domain-containing protein [bacterium]|nr:carboxypeptidase regulatory-like domain-containing protein [bacterium]
MKRLARLLLLGAFSLGACAGSHAPEAAALLQDAPTIDVVEHPAPTLQPEVPTADRDANDPAPAGVPLVRDGAVTGRFVAEGQKVRYPFEARAGELSLFDLGTWGYERGWQSGARIAVLDGQGRELAAKTPSGGTVYRAFLPFVAPDDGTYAVELTAEQRSFRFTLVRHSGYRARSRGDLLATKERELVHGWLAPGEDRVTYDLDLADGERVFVRVHDSHEAGRNQARAERRRRPETARAGRAQRQPAFPRFVVSTRGTRPAHSLFYIADGPGPHRVTVGARGSNPGGLFDLELQRDPPFVHVHGTVGDHEDEPVAGVELHFVREPDFDDLGRATTDAQGRYRQPLLPGAYTIVLAGSRADPVRTTIAADREVNLIFDGS